MTDATVAIRNAVKPFLQDCEPGDLVLVAVSGGADSLALAFAILKESQPLAISAVAVTVDHQLQENSSEQALKTENQLKEMGYEKVISKKVVVDVKSGIEAGARDARYQALSSIAEEEKATKIFLGHTRDDQAETVLLGLARGSGTRSLSGMAIKNGIYIRPLLHITRDETVKTCEENKITFWVDPHNSNLDFSRVRVRNQVLPVMESQIGPGIATALARSAVQLRDDADALDELTESEIALSDLSELDCQRLEGLPRAIRTRLIRAALYAAGAPAGSITWDHILSVEALITLWRGQGALSLPGGVKVERISGRLSLLAQP